MQIIIAPLRGNLVAKILSLGLKSFDYFEGKSIGTKAGL
jgi:hypothetical protein